VSLRKKKPQRGDFVSPSQADLFDTYLISLKKLLGTGSGTGDVEDESSATEMNYQAKQNVTLSERGRRHREDDAPIKSLLGNAVGLGILGGSDDEDNGEMVFKGGWATYFTQNMIPGLC
jgi:hypothetical protein